MWDSISKYLKGKSQNPEVDQFTKNMQADMNKDGTLNKGMTAGTDTDSIAPNSYNEFQEQQNEMMNRENPLEGRQALAAMSTEKKDKDNGLAKAIGSIGDSMSKSAGSNIQKPQYGSTEQALGKPVDVMEERRAALMKLLGR